MQTGKLINGISNRLRRRSQVVQKRIGISGAQGNVLDYILVESENHPVSTMYSQARALKKLKKNLDSDRRQRQNCCARSREKG